MNEPTPETETNYDLEGAIKEARKERLKERWRGNKNAFIGLALSLFVLLVYSWIKGYEAKGVIRDFVKSLPVYTQEEELLEDILDEAHSVVVKRSYPRVENSFGRRIQFSGFDEKGYVNGMFSEMQKLARKSGREDLVSEFQKLHILASKLAPELGKPRYANLQHSAPKKQVARARLLREPVPEPTTIVVAQTKDLIPVLVPVGVPAKYEQQIANSNRADLLIANPPSQQKGCYILGQGVTLKDLSDEEHNRKRTARIELDIVEHEQSQIYLRLREDSQGRDLCLVPRFTDGGNPKAGYKLAGDQSLCDCQSPSLVATRDPQLDKRKDLTSFERFELRRSATIKTSTLSKERERMERLAQIRKNLGVEGRERRIRQREFNRHRIEQERKNRLRRINARR